MSPTSKLDSVSAVLRCFYTTNSEHIQSCTLVDEFLTFLNASRRATHLAFDPQMIPLAYCTPRVITAGWMFPTLPKLVETNKNTILSTLPTLYYLQ